MTYNFGLREDNIDYTDRHGVYGIFKKEDAFGVVSVRDMYFLVGGGIEKDEDQITALKREFREETGYKIKVNDCIGKFVEYHFAKNICKHLKLINYIYEVELIEQIQEPEEDDHTLVWVKANEMTQSMVLEYQKSVVNFYLDYTSK